MRIVRHSGYPEGWHLDSKEPAAATIGNFDGLHLGHKALIDSLSREAGALKKVVLTFYPHPQIILGRAESIPVITSLRQKASLLLSWGVDELHLIRFTSKVSSIDFQTFLGEVLLNGLNVRTLVVGPDAKVGRQGEGTLEKIRKECKKIGQKVVVTEVLSDSKGLKISSRKIRDAIEKGDVKEAALHLGRNFTLSGRAIKGEGRGRTIGVPTINSVSRGQVLPKNGVYATKILLPGNGTLRNSVTNIGTRPTFGGSSISVETHVLEDISGIDIERGRLEVAFIDRIRDEKRFESKEALVSQIGMDIEASKLILKAK